MRTIPVIARREHEKSSSPNADLIFVRITHPDTTDVIRLVVDGVDYVMDDGAEIGATWHRGGFELDLLTDTEEPPKAEFRFPNVDWSAMGMLAKVNTPARVTFSVVTSAYFDLTKDPRTVKPGLTVEPSYRAAGLDLRDIAVDDVSVTGTLMSRDMRQEVWPNMRATKARLPGTHVR